MTMPPFDPSKMDPKMLMELTQLVRQLPPEKINRMQSLMHNMMAGLDVRREMEEFENGLPPGFREKLTSVMMGQTSQTGASVEPLASVEPPADMNLRDARMTVLRGVAAGHVSPEEAEKLLFKD